jgi:putative oxidoreductase
MKKVTLIARVLLGLVFLVFGLNGLHPFIPMPPPTGLAGQYMVVMFASHYMVTVFLIQVAGGALLLANRFVPLAVALLGPVLVNILLFHCLMAPEGLPLAVVVAALWLTVFFSVRRAFAGILEMRPGEAVKGPRPAA